MPEVIQLPEKNISSAYGVLTLNGKHRLIKKLKKAYTPSIHGHKTWSSSYLLMDYFLHQQQLKNNMSILEVGCGWGPASIFCAKKTNSRVTGLDRDEDVFPFLEVQAALNGVHVEPMVKSFEKVTKKQLTGFDMMMAADVCFWDELMTIHLNLIKRALAAGVKNIIYADPGRSPFFALADKCAANFGAEYVQWYCAEPEHFEGYILHICND